MTRRAERRRRERLRQEQTKEGRVPGLLTIATAIVVLVVVAAALVLTRNPGDPAVNAELPTEPLALGPVDAPVTIMEFGDYKCPHCKTFDDAVFPQIYNEFVSTGQARFIFVNYPFMGPDSTTAAIAARAVHRQDPDAFWQFHHGLFRAQGDPSQQWATPQFLVELARRVAPTIDHEQLAQDLNDPELLAEVRQEREYASSLGVRGTPTVFVNGKMSASPAFEHIRLAVEEALVEAGAGAGSGD